VSTAATPRRTTRGPAWDTSPQPRRGQSVLVVLAMCLLVPAVTATVLRVFPPTDDTPALAASFIPYGLLGYLGALVPVVVALVHARCRGVLIVVLLLVLGLSAAHLAWLGPLFVRDDRTVSTPTITVLSLNVFRGEADPRAIAAAAQRVDAVILVETTPEWLRSLKPLGWDERFPYALGDPADGDFNTAVYSRFPLSGSALIGPAVFHQWLTTVEAPGVGTIRLAAVHPCNPYCGGNQWQSEHAALRAVLRPHLDEPMIVAGDFNAVDDHGPMLQLRSDGLRSATDLAGAGWLPTYPANRAIPPLLPIDHVLLSRRLTATSVHRIRVAGTDHLGLVATIAGTG